MGDLRQSNHRTWSIIRRRLERLPHGIHKLIGELEHVAILWKRHFVVLLALKFERSDWYAAKYEIALRTPWYRDTRLGFNSTRTQSQSFHHEDVVNDLRRHGSCILWLELHLQNFCSMMPKLTGLESHYRKLNLSHDESAEYHQFEIWKIDNSEKSNGRNHMLERWNLENTIWSHQPQVTDPPIIGGIMFPRSALFVSLLQHYAFSRLMP